jgi:hypothetical protein
MKHISELTDIGIGKKCLIVGGGDSLNRFEWDKLEDTYVICINRHLSQMANMIVYYDADMKEYFEKHSISNDTLLIGFRHSDAIDHTIDKCTHFYNYKDMMYGDSGFHVLQFADKIFNFDEIYLIGLDYQVNGASYHHDEKVSDPKKLDDFEKFSVGMVLERFSGINWTNEIYNCSKNTGLKIFKYGLPY